MTPGGATYPSPVTKAFYPIAWQVTIPSLALDLQITTPLPSQEMTSSSEAGLSYWEGAIDITGTGRGSPLHGVGYLEMTGYAKRLQLGP